jgi:hypothetical protein
MAPAKGITHAKPELSFVSSENSTTEILNVTKTSELPHYEARRQTGA